MVRSCGAGIGPRKLVGIAAVGQPRSLPNDSQLASAHGRAVQTPFRVVVVDHCSRSEGDI